MKLHVLGTAGYHPNDFRQTACLMIPELGIILDAGSGFYRVRSLLPQVPAGMKIGIFLSHAHLDHVIGLTYGIDVFWGQKRDVTVYGLDTHIEAVEKSLFAKALFPVPLDSQLFNYRLKRWYPGRSGGSCINGVPFRRVLLPHPGDSVGYRFHLQDGDLAYVTDTQADQVPTEFVKGVRTLVAECNFTDHQVQLARDSGHSTTGQVLDLAARGGVKRLVCTHWNASLEMAAGQFLPDMTDRDREKKLGFELILAQDNAVIEL